MRVMLPEPKRNDETSGNRDRGGAAHERKPLRRAVSGLVSVAVVVGVFWFFLPQYTSVSEIWDAISGMSTLDVAALAVAAVWNLCTYSLLVLATMPGLMFRQAVVVTESSTAVSNTLPAGVAIGLGMSYSMYSSWGFSRSRSTVSLLVAGIWNNFVKLGMPIVALALLALDRQVSAGRVVLAVCGVAALVAAVAVFALVLRRDAFAARIGDGSARLVSAALRRVGRPAASGWGTALVTFRRRTVGLLQVRWRSITVAAVVSHASLFVVLLLALRAVDVDAADVSWVEALAVFSFARLVTAIPITPAGVGLVEVALITGLAAAGGARADVAAAVLVFRALTYVLPIPLGVITYVFWRRNRSWCRPPGTAPRPPGFALEPQSVRDGGSE